jgi:threonine dehydratase
MPYIRVTPVAQDLDTLLVSVGGGGLIGGIAAWCGGRPRVIGVEPESDAAIRQAQDALWATLRVVAEPGGAAAFSALLGCAYVPEPGERVGVVVSGGNTTAVDFDR